MLLEVERDRVPDAVGNRSWEDSCAWEISSSSVNLRSSTSGSSFSDSVMWTFSNNKKKYLYFWNLITTYKIITIKILAKIILS